VADVQQVLLRQQLVETTETAQEAAGKSEGSVEKALEALDAPLQAFYAELVEQLSQRDFDSSALAKGVATFVDAAGKESAAKRARLKQAIACAVDFYRRLMAASVRGDAARRADARDEAAHRAVAQAMRWWPQGEEAAAACIDACLDAASAVDANANQATLLECWLDELGTIARTGHGIAHA
jgi:DNA polymerase-3 subunit delta'